MGRPCSQDPAERLAAERFGVGAATAVRRKTTTLAAGLRVSGITAPFVMDGPIDQDTSEAYVERMLVPEPTPGDVAVMDILGTHTGSAERAAIAAAGAQMLVLPPCSPDFTPIAMAFSKIEALPRKAGERTVEEPWSAAGRLIATVTRDAYADLFAAAGYGANSTEDAPTAGQAGECG